ncbi:hypothetical protein BU23DRAFT_594659 [Bimuria novae-zelandiae CBS 107.79]|uniref:BTB domain-containing protein n=1 Tax=Bimuria novae-zelandiae CBS 107.79 TaxID=1447943 RepID=A0A6A5VXG8_9PLEO|nr:hypothetical protein BU23DRAFT_594659 [Bimuria novae-zelandiae CBS 107.79]
MAHVNMYKSLLSPFDGGPSITSEPIKILIGKTEEVTYAPKQLLESSSDFFKKALQEEWLEGSEHIVKLPTSNLESFGIYVKWLYTGKCSAVFFFFLSETAEGRAPVWTRLGKCYAMGDFLQDFDFKDAVVDAFAAGILDTVACPLRLSNFIYPYSRKDSNHRIFARDLIVHVFIRKVMRFDFIQNLDTPREYRQDILQALVPLVDNRISKISVATFLARNSPCHFHDHGDAKPCYRKRFNP